MEAYTDKRVNTLYIVIADESSGGNHSTYRYTGSTFIKVSDELSASEVKALYEANANTNVFTNAEKTKLSEFEDANYYNKTYIDNFSINLWLG